MKTKWIGKYDGKNLPTVDVEVGAKKLSEVTSKSAIMLAFCQSYQQTRKICRRKHRTWRQNDLSARLAHASN